MLTRNVFLPGGIFFVLVVIAVGLASCDESFQPLKENNKYIFSIYGYLDASADTQWVRVTPARSRLEMQEETPEMTVTLEEVETGQTTVMNDSLFLPANDFNYLNYWTTMDILPEHTYLLKAERPDGATSSVEVTIPEDFPTPKITYTRQGCWAYIYINGVKRIADVQTIWDLRVIISGDNRRIFRIPYRREAVNTRPGSYTVFINTVIRGRVEIGAVWDNPLVQGIQVMVAAGGPEWVPEVENISSIEYALPEGFSNVDNGVGYLVGVVKKTITYEGCYDEGDQLLNP